MYRILITVLAYIVTTLMIVVTSPSMANDRNRNGFPLNTNNGLILKDANGKQIGDVLSVDYEYFWQTGVVSIPNASAINVVITAVVSVGKLTDNRNEDRLAIIPFRTSSITNAGGPFFLTSNCTGTPYISTNDGFPPLISQTNVVRSGTATGAAVSLYVATTDQVETPSFHSQLNGDTGIAVCEPFNATVSAVEAELVTDALNEFFSAPFRLEHRARWNRGED